MSRCVHGVPDGWACSICAQQPRVSKSRSNVGLDSFAQAVTYILSEIESSPGDSLRDIANEAFEKYNISLACNRDFSVVPYKWEAD